MAQDFDDFFLREYDRISEAYFKTVASISEFMRHYLTIVSVPPALFALLTRAQDADPVFTVIRQHPLMATMPLFGIALVGFFLCRYLIALAMNAHLYARTVNGVRAHFAAKIAVGDTDTLAQIVLPIDVSKPPFGAGTINHVVRAMGIVNAGYTLFGIYILDRLTHWWWTASAVWILPIAALAAHLISYRIQSNQMENDWPARRAVELKG